MTDKDVLEIKLQETKQLAISQCYKIIVLYKYYHIKKIINIKIKLKENNSKDNIIFLKYNLKY